MRANELRGVLPSRWATTLALLAAVVTPILPMMGQGVTTNWVVFNDHAEGFGTAANVTTYNLWTGPGGYLTNFTAADEYEAGQELLVRLDVSVEGSVASQATMLLPDLGTPADQLFTGILDMNGPSFLFTLNVPGRTIMKFTGLDPAMHYRFQTTGARGRQSDAPNRWTMCALYGAASFTEAFTSAGGTNAISKKTFPSSTLTNAQIAWNSGRNQDAGDLIGWDEIAPTADGTFSVTTEQYTGPVPGGSGAGAYGYGLAGFQLMEVGARAPVAFATQPAAQITVEEAHPFELKVRISGSSPRLQWYKQGTGPIAGATHPVFAITNAAVADSGDYYAVACNSFGSVTSILTHVVVAADITAPVVVAVSGAEAFDMLDSVHVRFSELLQGTQDTANYTVTGFRTTAVVFDASRTNALVTLDKPLTPGQSYSLTVRNARDLAGNVMGTATIAFQANVLARGFLRWDYWGGLDQANNVVEDTLLADSRFPKSPDRTAFISAFNSRMIFPDDTHEAYGSRITAYFVPPTSGKWIFFIRSDKSSRLYLNKNGTDPAGKEIIAEETDCCDAFVASGIPNDDGITSATSDPLTLTAGQRYYIEAIHKEGTGSDYVQVAAKLETDSTAPAKLLPLPGSLFETLVDPAGASVTIKQQPVSITVVQPGPQGGPATLLDESFDANDGGFTTNSETATAPARPWTWSGTSWVCASPGGSGPYATHFTSPTVTVPSAGTLSVSFNHRYSMESPSTFYDGGVIQISVNGGDFTNVGATNFVANGYVGNLVGAHELSGLGGFSGNSVGYQTPVYITSTAYFGSFSAGDTLAVRFAAAWDGNTEGTEPNWEIDSMKLELGVVGAVGWATFNVGAEVNYQGAPSTCVSYVWQRDNGSGFQDITVGDFISPLNQPIYLIKAGPADNGAKFRCIVQGINASVISEVATLTVTTNLAVRPLLSTQRQGPNILLSWPLTASGFTLQQTPALPAVSWTSVPSKTYVSNAISIYTTVPVSGTAFFRLSQ